MTKKKDLKEAKTKEVKLETTTFYRRYVNGKKVVVEATSLKEAEEKFKLLFNKK